MTSPTVQTTSTGGDGSGGTSHTITLPSGIIATDLILILLSFSSSPGTLTLSGFSAIGTTDTVGSATIAEFFKSATGAEGASVSLTTQNSCAVSYICYRIRGWQGTPEKGTASGAASANADPPSVTPSWGSDADLFIATFGDGGLIIGTVAPTNYSNLLTGTSSGSAISAAQRNLTASSDNPGTFTSSSTSWVAQTIAIRAGAILLTASTVSYAVTPGTIHKALTRLSSVVSYAVSIPSIPRSYGRVTATVSYAVTVLPAVLYRLVAPANKFKNRVANFVLQKLRINPPTLED